MDDDVQAGHDGLGRLAGAADPLVDRRAARSPAGRRAVVSAAGPGVFTATRRGVELTCIDPLHRRWSDALAAPDPAAAQRALLEHGAASMIARGADGALLWALRDPFGIAPLHIADGPGGLHLSSTRAAVFRAEGPVARELPPGTALVGGDARPYHRLPASPEPYRPDRIRELLVAAVARLIGPWRGRIALLLSGGIDSCALAWALRHLRADVVAVTVGLPGSSDVAHAAELAAHLGLRLEARTFAPDEVLATTPRALAAVESFNHSLVRNSIPTRLALEAAAELGCCAALTGDASDGLFAGQPYLADGDPAGRTALYRREFADLHRTENRRVQSQATAVGIPVGQPYLDRSLVEAVWGLPLEDKVRAIGGRIEQKHALRQALRGHLPEAFCARAKLSIDAGSAMELTTRHHEEAIDDAAFARASAAFRPIKFVSKEHLAYFEAWRDLFFPGGTDYDLYRPYGAYGSWQFYYE